MSIDKRFDLDVGKRRVRNKFREFLKKRVDFKNTHVLCLPGANGYEIEQVYRKLGFRDANIHGVERDPAAAREIRRRYPNIDVFEGDLNDFCQEYEGPPLAVVSLDYCGVWDHSKVAPLGILAARRKTTLRAVVHTNFMSGRESSKGQQSQRETFLKILQRQRREPFQDPRDKALLAAAESESLGDVRDTIVTYATMDALFRELAEFDIYNGVRDANVGYGPANITAPVVDLGSKGLPIVVDTNSWGHYLRAQAFYDLYTELRERFDYPCHGESWAQVTARQLMYNMMIKQGGPYFTVALSRYSYVSESKKRMLTDFLEINRLRADADALPEVARFCGFADGSAKFSLWPDPSAFSTVDNYHAYLHKAVVATQRLFKRHQNDIDQWPERVDLGGGETFKMDMDKAREKIIQLIQKGRSDEEILARYPIQPATISALRAHVTRGTYEPGL